MDNQRQPSGLAFASLAVSLLATCTHANAQEQTEERDRKFVVEEVIVHGAQIQRQLLDTASSLAVYDAAAIEAEPAEDISDLLLKVPNVNAAREDKFSLRGISNQGLTGRSRRLAALFIDGVRQQGRGVAHTYDIEQVEIYRGPQSTAFGPGSLAGAIYIKTADPEPDWGAKVSLGVGTAGAKNAAFSLTGPISDSVSFRATVDYNSTDGEVENETLGIDDWQGQSRYMHRLKMKWDPGESGGYWAMLTLQESRLREGPELLPVDTAEEGKAYDNEEGFFDDDSLVYGLTQYWEINDTWQLTSLTTFSKTYQDRLGDYDAGPKDNGYFIIDSEFENKAQEFRLNYNADSLRGVLGLYLADDSFTSNSFNDDVVVEINTGITPLTIVGDASTAFFTGGDTRSIFGEVEWEALSWLTVVAGGRYEENEPENSTAFILHEATVFDRNTGLAVPPAVGTPVIAQVLPDSQSSSTGEDDIFLPKLGLTFHINDALNVFVIATSGYRGGGTEVTSDGRVSQYDPEETDNVDLGFRFQGERLTATGTVFKVDWHDQQVRIRQDDGINIVTENAGESKIEGAELELSYIVTPSLSVYAGAGWIKTEFLRFNASSGDLSGNEFPGAPDYNAVAGIQYRFLDHYYVNLGYSYSDGNYVDAENTEELRADRYELFNLKAGYRGDNVSINAYVSNLADEFYKTDHFINSTYGLNGIIVGDRREAGVSLQYVF